MDETRTHLSTHKYQERTHKHTRTHTHTCSLIIESVWTFPAQLCLQDKHTHAFMLGTLLPLKPITQMYTSMPSKIQDRSAHHVQTLSYSHTHTYTHKHTHTVNYTEGKVHLQVLRQPLHHHPHRRQPQQRPLRHTATPTHITHVKTLSHTHTHTYTHTHTVKYTEGKAHLQMLPQPLHHHPHRRQPLQRPLRHTATPTHITHSKTLSYTHTYTHTHTVKYTEGKAHLQVLRQSLHHHSHRRQPLQRPLRHTATPTHITHVKTLTHTHKHTHTHTRTLSSIQRAKHTCRCCAIPSTTIPTVGSPCSGT